MSALNRRFHITERGSTVATELRGGLTTFATMAYIIALNPIILAGSADAGGNKLDIGQLTTSTALVAAVMTLSMGLFANLPIAMAAGLGLNGVVAYQIAPQMSWAGAMGIVVLEGLVVLVLVLLGVRERAFNIVPIGLRYAIAGGIGLFIAYIGFVDAGFIRRNPDIAGTPAPGGLGINGELRGWPVLVFVVGLLFTAVLMKRGKQGAILIGIVGTTIFAMMVNWLANVPAAFSGGKYNPEGWGLNVPGMPHDILRWPDFGLFGNISFTDSFHAVGWFEVVLLVFSLAVADFFDTLGTGTAVATEAFPDEKREGFIPRLRWFLGIDAIGAIVGGWFGQSSATSYIESLAGVGSGARTGLASIVTGGLFLLGLFATPLVEVIPYEAAAPALVIVGIMLLFEVAQRIEWEDLGVSIPAALILMLMPFSFSITVGMGAGFVSYSVLQIFGGTDTWDRHRRQSKPWVMHLIALVFVAYFMLHYIRGWA